MTDRRGKPLKAWLGENALWFAGLGLMLASSGIDGAYMARWMPTGWGWLGLVLNTVSDISGTALMFSYGWLKRNNAKTTKKHKMASVLLGAEFIAVVYSWFFSWRQLRIVLVPIEGAATRWVSWVSAGFVPLLLAFIGWAQSLIVEPAEESHKRSESEQSEPQETQGKSEETPVDQTSQVGKSEESQPQAALQKLRAYGSDESPELTDEILASMTKAERIRYLASNFPELAQVDIADKSGASESYVSRVMKDME